MTGSVGAAPLVLFAIVAGPPHVGVGHALSRGLRRRRRVPMLPVVRSAPAVASRILAYSVITVAVSLALWPVADTGWLYPVVAMLAGAVAVGVLAAADSGPPGLGDAALKPMRLFHWSNSYLALIFVAAAISPLLLDVATHLRWPSRSS